MIVVDFVLWVLPASPIETGLILLTPNLDALIDRHFEIFWCNLDLFDPLFRKLDQSH
jgi:hypothetical protein